MPPEDVPAREIDVDEILHPVGEGARPQRDVLVGLAS